MFGYTDQGADPRPSPTPTDPRLTTGKACCPASRRSSTSTSATSLAAWLRWLGYTAHDPEIALATEHEARRALRHPVPHRPLLSWLGEQDAVVRPRVLHPAAPPLDTAGHSARCTPADCPPALPIPPTGTPCTTCCCTSGGRGAHRPGRGGPPALAVLRDDHRGRSPHGPHRRRAEGTRRVGQHGRHRHLRPRRAARRPGPRAEGGLLRASYHISVVRDPRQPGAGIVASIHGERRHLPTLCEAIGQPVPCSATASRSPRSWRRATTPLAHRAHYEWDWRDVLIPMEGHVWPWQRQPRATQPRRRAHRHPRVRTVRRRRLALFRPRRRPRLAVTVTDPAVVLPLAQRCWCGASSNSTARSPACSSSGSGAPAAPPYPVLA